MNLTKYQTLKILEQQLKEDLAKLDDLKRDEEVAAAQSKEQDFIELTKDLTVETVTAMMIARFGLNEVNRSIAPFNADQDSTPRSRAAAQGNKRPRKRKTWTNPHTGESFTAGKASGPVLDWINEHGKETVAGWAVEAD